MTVAVKSGGAVKKFREIRENRHEYAKEWKKRTGGKVLGYFCTYVPEELIEAAGVLPVRILGSHEPEDLTEPHIYKMYCPFCRDCLAQGLRGRYDYLDGIMIAHSCTHIRQTYSSWTIHLPTSFQYYFSMPAKVQGAFAKPFLVAEMKAFKEALEKWTGQKISDAKIDEAINVYNTNRRLMGEIYELRKNTIPPISGTQSMEMVVASQMMDKKEHNELLKQALIELKNKKDGVEPSARLIIIGSEDDDTEFLEMVESLGASIVVDDHCTGSRYFWTEVIPGGDRLEALADRYLLRPPCPQKDWEERKRWPHISKLIDDWKVQGALLIQQKFCDPHEFDIPYLSKNLKEKKNIPSLFLEFDVLVPVGQFRTRVEAFLEIIQQASLEF